MAEREDKPKENEPNKAGKEADARPEDSLEADEAAGAPEETAQHEQSGMVDDRLAQLEAEAAELKDQLLRAVAETENVRNRARREREESLKYAAVPFIKDLLNVADNLQRAIAAVPEEAAAENEQFRTLLTGVQLTAKELAGVFQKHSIAVIDPLGEPLDPHSHEAMFEVPDPEKPSGTVVQVIQPGYRLHSRLLRPARVGVAKGGPKPAAPDNGENTANQPPGTTVDTQA